MGHKQPWVCMLRQRGTTLLAVKGGLLKTVQSEAQDPSISTASRREADGDVCGERTRYDAQANHRR